MHAETHYYYKQIKTARFCMHTLLDLEVELYQKKIKMTTRPSTAMNAKITNSNELTARSSTILLVDLPAPKPRSKFKIHRSQSPSCGIGIRQCVHAHARSLYFHVCVMSYNCTTIAQSTTPFFGVKASSLQRKVSV